MKAYGTMEMGTAPGVLSATPESAMERSAFSKFAASGNLSRWPRGFENTIPSTRDGGKRFPLSGADLGFLFIKVGPVEIRGLSLSSNSGGEDKVL